MYKRQEGRKTLTIPNWDTNTNKYCIKIENKNGEEVYPHDYYKISFKVTENKEQEKNGYSFSVFLYLRWSVSFLCFIQKTMTCRMY